MCISLEYKKHKGETNTMYVSIKEVDVAKSDEAGEMLGWWLVVDVSFVF